MRIYHEKYWRCIFICSVTAYVSCIPNYGASSLVLLGRKRCIFSPDSIMFNRKQSKFVENTDTISLLSLNLWTKNPCSSWKEMLYISNWVSELWSFFTTSYIGMYYHPWKFWTSFQIYLCPLSLKLILQVVCDT